MDGSYGEYFFEDVWVGDVDTVPMNVAFLILGTTLFFTSFFIVFLLVRIRK
jgi:hypothetical protein